MTTIKEIRCPRCKKLLGKYDARFGVKGVVYYCNRVGCKREFRFDIPPEISKIVDNLKKTL